MHLIIGGTSQDADRLIGKLLEDGKQVIVLNDLSSSVREEINKQVIFIKGHYTDEQVISFLFRTFAIKKVYMFTADNSIGLCMEDAKRYYNNHISGPFRIVKTMAENGIHSFHLCVSAFEQQESANPSIREKELLEQLINDYCQVYGVHFYSGIPA
ncbi:NAD-dependent epimerase/dehydratase family protein [Bacillus sp. 1P06AnD]|uniref:NAD-dependent epimerase/dehydratase family protein n=1 Tax=Bacillus sp. 1P06AnD TaxID=3132208 RepID=UPI0039A2EE74